jgi:adenylosuccinate synthase
MPITVIVGEQRGDEGKGRFVDMLAESHDIVARFNGGNNAGHTVVLPDSRVLKLHVVPSGIAYPHIVNVIGNGTLIHPVRLNEEIASIEAQGIKVSPDNLKISSAAHLITPAHVSADEIREAGAGRQGSTKSGIAQVAAAKYMRTGVRVEMIHDQPDELHEYIVQGLKEQRDARQKVELSSIDEIAVADEYMESALKLSVYSQDTTLYLNRMLRSDSPARVLAEGAQAYWLDIDHGMYPFSTSSSTTTGGVATGLGVPPYIVTRVVGVSKAVQSHVGDGPFVTEIHDKEVLSVLHGDMESVDAEKGTTTGRIRRLGYLDLPAIRRAQMVNGTHEMALTKLDWVSRFGREVKVCVAYKCNSNTMSVAPDAAHKLEQCTPVYETLPGWDEPIQDVRTFSDLPAAAQRYIEFIEQQTGVHVSMIGVGPQRDQVITRPV